jgi:hypothetical protein
MKLSKSIILGMSIIAMMTAAAPLASAEAAKVKWDMISVTFGTTTILNPGGSATAIASDGSTLTITGTGTFVSPASGGTSSAVTGGGTWTVVSPSGTTTGTFVVTELVQWHQTTGFAGFGLVDSVGNINQAVGGLAVLRVAYSDGTTGVLTISCNAPADPFAVFEGMIASKGAVQYWNPSIFTYFSLFHVV